MNDAIVISDLHLGSPNCRAEFIIEFLERIRKEEIKTSHLVLNGDVFDSIDFRRLKKKHWKVLSLLRKISDRVAVTWINGNHDGPTEFLSHLIGTEIREEVELESGASKILVFHGHRFDDFIETYPRITFVADFLYRCLQYLDRSHRIARFAKSNSKVFLRCANKIRMKAMDLARERGFDTVICGHTHHAETAFDGNVHYLNSGCWTEATGTYLRIANGSATLEQFVPATAPVFEQVNSADDPIPAFG